MLKQMPGNSSHVRLQRSECLLVQEDVQYIMLTLNLKTGELLQCMCSVNTSVPFHFRME